MQSYIEEQRYLQIIEQLWASDNQRARLLVYICCYLVGHRRYIDGDRCESLSEVTGELLEKCQEFTQSEQFSLEFLKLC